MLVAISVAIAIATHPFRMRNRRLLTGAWTSRIGERLAKSLIERSNDRFQKANESVMRTKPGVSTPDLDRKAQILKRRFPYPACLTPTRLGNAYEALRKLVRDQKQVSLVYDATEPEAYRDAHALAVAAKDPIVPLMTDVRLQIAAAERYTVTWIVVAGIFAVLLVGHGWWPLLSVAALALAHISYVGAVDSVVEFNYLLDQLFARYDRTDDTGQSGGDQRGVTPAA
jgi:hypothetical protein